ncbi:hypothetical protein V5799_032702 [Amblyomma americanum]|uniref:Uncharacterized protein n=1 Tax=Amblyomma americanum TaxID=6943 RepID=A0AAQ4DQE5_AMBAM
MAPKDWDLWMYSNFVYQLCPKLCGPVLFSSASEAYARLQEIKLILRNSGANFRAQCARGSRHACELPRQLKQWNRVLAAINVQLRERNTPGELEVICFLVPGDKPDSACRLQRAILLVRWLLVTHSCVTAIRVDEWGVLQCPAYFDLFCDCLRQSRRLRSLRLSVHHPKTSEHERPLAAMCDLRHLEEFASQILHVDDYSRDMSALCNVVARNAKSERLAVEQFIDESDMSDMWNMSGMSDIAPELTTNATITDLSIGVSCLKATEHDLFTQALKANTSLQSLRLVGSRRKHTLSVAAIARATEGLTALVNLELSHFLITTSEAWALALSVSHSGAVQQLALISCMPLFTYLVSVPRTGDDSYKGAHWRIQPLVHMLLKATSLRKLTVCMNAYRVQDQRVFFEALAANDFIEEVNIQNPHKFPELCPLICETDTGSRVKIDTIRMDERSLESAPKGLHIRDVRLVLDGRVRPGEVQRCLAQLSTFNSVTSLSVHGKGAIDAETAELLAQYLRKTRLLSDVTLNFFARHNESLVLLDALSDNTSITTLGVEHWCESVLTARILADIICSSKMIRALTYNLTSCNPSPAFFSALAKHIEGNCTLISVKSYRLKSLAKYWNFIQEVVACNSTLLVRAAQYVTGCAVEKSGAEALELLGSDHMLVAKVQEMASVDEKEANDAINSKLADLDDLDVFMSASGVVRERVVCQESAEGHLCLDTIPYDCWRILRRYLRVRHVVDTESAC